MADVNQVIVEDGEQVCQLPLSTHVHHRNFPEIWTECETAAEGAAQLSGLLAREAEGAGDNWQRGPIQQAVADVEAFVEASDHPVDAPAGG